MDALDVALSRGFVAITGETGAGKSIILDAINFCFGKFSGAGARKNPSVDCTVSIKFALSNTSHISKIVGLNLPPEITLERTLDTNGKVTCRINGRKISPKIAKEIMPYLVQITAQSDSILPKATQQEALDNFLLTITPEVAPDLSNTSNLFDKICNIERKIRALEEEARIARRDKAYYTQVVSELGGLQIRQGEETELLSRRAEVAKLCANNNLLKASTEALRTLPSLASQSARNLDKINSEITNNLGERLRSVSIELTDVLSSLEELVGNISNAEQALSEIDDRLSAIRAVARKYNTAANTLFEFAEDAREKLRVSENFEQKLNALTTEEDTLLLEYDIIAEKLYLARCNAAEKMSADICGHLTKLLLPNAVVKVDVQRTAGQRTRFGADTVEFLANFNKNAKMLPIAKIASGGEAARLNFALKTTLGTCGKSDTIIFDEVDVGIGGAAAYAMGSMIRELSEAAGTQVIAITHSPQVAACANSHILVKKEFGNGEVAVSAQCLDKEKRITELARMLSGDVITPAACDAARQLLGEK